MINCGCFTGHLIERAQPVPLGRFGQAPLIGAELSRQRHFIL